jgi:hypothetical protein
MAFLDELMTSLGAMWDRAHIFTFSKDEAEGVTPRFTRDLRPVPETGMTGGHLLELYAVVDERYELDAAARIRLDVLEEDWLFSGGLDDRIVSLAGTGAGPPEPGATITQVPTRAFDLPAERDFAWFVEEYKRTNADFADSILVVRETPAANAPGVRRTHVLGWHRFENDDIGSVSEVYFLLDVADRFRASSPVVEIGDAPQGLAVRLRGTLTDLEPLVAANPEPLDDIPVTLAGRRAVSGADGRFVIDARLPVGDHALRFERPGIDSLELTVRVTAAADGRVTAAVRDAGGGELVSRTTAEPSTTLSMLELTLPQPVRLRVHKLRGTVLWPDSLTGNVAVGYRGSPLADRRIYIMPLPAAGTIADRRPKSTKDWEAMKRRPEVLRSTRPGRPAQRERTDRNGQWEVKYVDYTAGNRFLVWVERFDPQGGGDTTTEAPDHIVRIFRRELIQLEPPPPPGQPAARLTTWGRAGDLRRNNRLLVDHEYTALTGDTVPLGVEALRVADFPGPQGRTLVRPQQLTRVAPVRRPSSATRQQFETLPNLALDTGDNLSVPASRAVGTIAAAPNSPVRDGLELHVLPLVPVYERPDQQGDAARRASERLAAAAAADFADYADVVPPAAPAQRQVGADRGEVRLVLDTRRLAEGFDLVNGPWDATHDPDADARKVRLLESTFVVRPQLGTGLQLGVEDARWHIDAMSLADTARVRIDAADPRIRTRELDGDVHPVLAALAPFMPGIAPRQIYLAPGHGLWASPANSVQPLQWRSERGGYAENAGEDEVDSLLAAEMNRILLRNGATVHTCRELADFTTPGVRHSTSALPAARFTPVLPAANADYPRRWQQNPVYHLGARLDPAVHGVNAIRSAQGDKNPQGITARARHLDALAQRGQVDLIFAPHTNAVGGTAAPGLAAPAEGNSRGMLVEYLNVDTQAGGEGNPMGLGLATRTLARMNDRCRTAQRGVFRMNMLNPGVVGDLRDTFDHWVLNDANLPGVNELRRRNPPGPIPPVGQVPPNAPQQPPGVVASWNRLNDPPGPAGPPPVPAPAGQVVNGVWQDGRTWQRERFPTAGAPVEVPSALAEVAFHDNREDARLLRRAWFRRLAAEGAVMGMDAQLRSNTAAVTNGTGRRVLERAFGRTPAVAGALPGNATATATPATLLGALRAVANPDPNLAAPPDASLGSLVAATFGAARALPRSLLVQLMRDALRAAAGWESGDPVAERDAWIAGPMTRGAPLDRPGAPPTRAEAGALACRAVGLPEPNLTTAETQPVGAARTPLLRPAPGGADCYFPRIEADVLVARLSALQSDEVHRVTAAWLADSRWRPLRTAGEYGHLELDAGAPVIVVVETGGAAWKTANQLDPDPAERLSDVEIRVEAVGERRDLGCSSRDPLRVTSRTWHIDLPPTQDPVELTVELWLDQATRGRLRVGVMKLPVKVRPIPAP